MQNSFIDFKEKRDLVVTTGYDRAKRTTKPWSFTSFKASESLKSTNEDMCKFIKANLSISNTNLDSLFSNNFESKNISFNDRLFISMGWHIIKAKDLNIITHTGKTSGHTTFIGFVRETNTGVVVSSNSAFGSEDLGMLVLRMLNFNWNRNFK
jgi:beta-lactamase class C